MQIEKKFSVILDRILDRENKRTIKDVRGIIVKNEI